MELVFDPPVTAHRAGESLGAERGGGDVEAPLGRGLAGLLASLLNLALGCYLSLGVGWRKKAAMVGSTFLWLSPAVLVAAFVLEAPKGTPDRLLTLVGIFMVFIGALYHVPGRNT